MSRNCGWLQVKCNGVQSSKRLLTLTWAPLSSKKVAAKASPIKYKHNLMPLTAVMTAYIPRSIAKCNKKAPLSSIWLMLTWCSTRFLASSSWRVLSAMSSGKIPWSSTWFSFTESWNWKVDVNPQSLKNTSERGGGGRESICCLATLWSLREPQPAKRSSYTAFSLSTLWVPNQASKTNRLRIARIPPVKWPLLQLMAKQARPKVTYMFKLYKGHLLECLTRERPPWRFYLCHRLSTLMTTVSAH